MSGAGFFSGTAEAASGGCVGAGFFSGTAEPPSEQGCHEGVPALRARDLDVAEWTFGSSGAFLARAYFGFTGAVLSGGGIEGRLGAPHVSVFTDQRILVSMISPCSLS